jgi:dipeptidyl aminopeptidase/acylaminoacyl peptidase
LLGRPLGSSVIVAITVVAWRLACTGAAATQTPPDSSVPPSARDGQVLDERPCDELPEHALLDAFGRGYFDAESWERLRGNGVRCQQIHYASGGVAVEGFLLQPPEPSGARFPAIIYNRGGTGDFGKIDAVLLGELRLLAEEGFVVAASNYRYVGARAREDQWGGDDLDDVMNLVPLLRARSDVDGRNLFMLGVSRGGTMTYLALKRGVDVNAAAVIAGATDLSRLVVDRPEFVLGDEGFDGWAKVWPDFRRKSREQLGERSAVEWADRIDRPVLILHSRVDRLLSVLHAIDMARRLQEHGKEYELVIYGQDGHSLPLHRSDRNRRITSWFREHASKEDPRQDRSDP